MEEAIPNREPDPTAAMGRIAATLTGWRLDLTIVATALLLTLWIGHIPLDSDVAWQLWVAHHLRLGARFAVDIIETNPPLWFWMAMPIDGIAQITGASAGPILIALGALLCAGSAIPTGRLGLGAQHPARLPFTLYLLLMLLVLPLPDFGQREHIALAGALPYAALGAVRRRHEPIPTRLAVLIGIGAALGFALKPYFLLAPLALEMWLAIALGRSWRPVRTETVVLAFAAAVYALLAMILTPAFFTAVVPLNLLAYTSTGGGFASLLLNPALWIGCLIAAFLIAQGRALPPLASALTLIAGGFAAGYLIQHKGWPYQAIAMIGCLAAALAASLAARDKALSPSFRLSAAGLLLLTVSFGLLHPLHKANPTPDMIAATAGLHAGDSVAIVTSDNAEIWPITLDRGFRFPSRYNGFWMLRAIVQAERGDADPRLEELGRTIARQTTLDFACAPPVRIIFDRPTSADGFDIRGFFMRDAAFSALMHHYEHSARYGDLDVFTQRSPIASLPAALCRRGV